MFCVKLQIQVIGLWGFTLCRRRLCERDSKGWASWGGGGGAVDDTSNMQRWCRRAVNNIPWSLQQNKYVTSCRCLLNASVQRTSRCVVHVWKENWGLSLDTILRILCTAGHEKAFSVPKLQGEVSNTGQRVGKPVCTLQACCCPAYIVDLMPSESMSHYLLDLELIIYLLILPRLLQISSFQWVGPWEHVKG